jgi:hypothetical protein
MDKEKLIRDYKNDGHEILLKIIDLINRASQKVEDKKYKETLEKLKLL